MLLCLNYKYIDICGTLLVVPHAITNKEVYQPHTLTRPSSVSLCPRIRPKSQHQWAAPLTSVHLRLEILLADIVECCEERCFLVSTGAALTLGIKII